MKSKINCKPDNNVIYTDELNSYSRLSKENFAHGVFAKEISLYSYDSVR